MWRQQQSTDLRASQWLNDSHIARNIIVTRRAINKSNAASHSLLSSPAEESDCIHTFDNRCFNDVVTFLLYS